MFRLVHKIYSILNEIKKFEAGYSTANTSQLIIQYEGKNYRLDFTELGEGDIGKHVNNIK
jgi:hypothetical protein